MYLGKLNIGEICGLAVEYTQLPQKMMIDSKVIKKILWLYQYKSVTHSVIQLLYQVPKKEKMQNTF